MRPDYVSPINASNIIYKDLRPLQVLSTEVDTITKKHKKLNKPSARIFATFLRPTAYQGGNSNGFFQDQAKAYFV